MTVYTRIDIVKCWVSVFSFYVWVFFYWFLASCRWKCYLQWASSMFFVFFYLVYGFCHIRIEIDTTYPFNSIFMSSSSRSCLFWSAWEHFWCNFDSSFYSSISHSTNAWYKVGNHLWSFCTGLFWSSIRHVIQFAVNNDCFSSHLYSMYYYLSECTIPDVTKPTI